MFKHIIITSFVLGLAAGSIAAAADLRDPTRPDTAVAPTANAPATRFVVSAIFVSDERRVAIVNGKMVTAGDRIGGATVRAIDAHSVTLRYQNKTIHARLLSTKVRK